MSLCDCNYLVKAYSIFHLHTPASRKSTEIRIMLWRHRKKEREREKERKREREREREKRGKNKRMRDNIDRIEKRTK